MTPTMPRACSAPGGSGLGLVLRKPTSCLVSHLSCRLPRFPALFPAAPGAGQPPCGRFCLRACSGASCALGPICPSFWRSRVSGELSSNTRPQTNPLFPTGLRHCPASTSTCSNQARGDAGAWLTSAVVSSDTSLPLVTVRTLPLLPFPVSAFRFLGCSVTPHPFRLSWGSPLPDSVLVYLGVR